MKVHQYLKGAALLALAAWFCVSVLTSLPAPQPEASHTTAAASGARVTAELITQHHCWGNDGLPHPIPGHVVAYTHDAATPVYGGPHLTGMALANRFDPGHPNKWVHIVEFCA